MAEKQGQISIYLRREAVLLYPRAVVGGREEADGWHGITTLDPKVGPMLLSWETSDQGLGAGLRSTLRSSRARIPEPYLEGGMVALGHLLAPAFQLKASSTVLAGLKCCDAIWYGAKILFEPLMRKRGGFAEFRKDWNKGHEDIVIPFSASDEDLGAAVREALRRSL